ncbi:MAG TPA: SRPBCC family protein [Actinomycetota bacterium]
MLGIRWSDADPSGLLIFTMEVEIPRPPEVVWPYLVDWEGLDRWMEEARAFRVLGEPREGVGVEAEATISILGITTRDLVRVTRWEPPAVLEIEHLGWVSGRGLMELGVTAVGSHLFWREALRPPLGPLGRIGMRLMSPVIHRTFRRDLETLRELIERET